MTDYKIGTVIQKSSFIFSSIAVLWDNEIAQRKLTSLPDVILENKGGMINHKIPKNNNEHDLRDQGLMIRKMAKSLFHLNINFTFLL